MSVVLEVLVNIYFGMHANSVCGYLQWKFLCSDWLVYCSAGSNHYWPCLPVRTRETETIPCSTDLKLPDVWLTHELTISLECCGAFREIVYSILEIICWPQAQPLMNDTFRDSVSYFLPIFPLSQNASDRLWTELDFQLSPCTPFELSFFFCCTHTHTNIRSFLKDPLLWIGRGGSVIFACLPCQVMGHIPQDPEESVR